MEDDPIELYEDDSLSLGTFDRFDTPLQDNDVSVVRVEPSLVAHPESSSTMEQSAETLYKKMLALRTNVSQSYRHLVLFFSTLVLGYGSKPN